MTDPIVYSITSTSNKSADVNLDDPITLSISNGGNHRLLLKPQIVRASATTPAMLKFTFCRQRKAKSDIWENLETPKVALKINEANAMKLDSREMAEMIKHLENLKAIIADADFRFQDDGFIVAPKSKVLEVSDTNREAIKKLVASNPKEIWQELLTSKQSLAHQLAIAKINEERKAAVEEFKANLDNDSEEWWQKFFERNSWIFGYALNFKWLHLYESKAYAGGKKPDNTEGNVMDFALNSVAEAKFTVCVEIKTPVTPLVTATSKKGAPRVKETTMYRNNTALLSRDLLGGVSQTQNYCDLFTVTSQQGGYAEQLKEDDLMTVHPKGILVIGRLNSLKGDKDAARTFHMFRQNLNNPDVITYDELLERAEHIVLNPPIPAEEKDDATEAETGAVVWDDDIPPF